MGKAIDLYSYKELKDVPLSIIHAKYAPKEITKTRLYQRIVKSGMNIATAITMPLATQASVSEAKKPQYRKILEQRFNEICQKCKDHVAMPTYFRRLHKGMEPINAVPKSTKTFRRFKRPFVETKEIQDALKELRGEEVKSKYKSFTEKEIRASKEDAMLYNLLKIPKSLT